MIEQRASIVAYGAGLVGEFVCRQLSDNLLTIVDTDQVRLDALTEKLHECIAVVGDAIEHAEGIDSTEYALALNMLPGRVGDRIREILITKGLDVVDIAFCAEDPARLRKVARESGAILIHDVGIAPGLSNILIAEAAREMGDLLKVSIKVGGNPVHKDDGWSYMAPFSPTDVIEEYTRPARIIDSGKMAEVAAITELHEIEVKGHGSMEAFLTDGLRSLLDWGISLGIDDMREYTVRWPGHIQKYIELRAKGELDERKLVEEWRLDPSRNEFTWMRLEIKSTNGESRTWEYDCQGTIGGDQSMAISTGLVAVAVSQSLLTNRNSMMPGVYAPEDLPSSICDRVQSVFDKRGNGALERVE